jgi:hypothetical protein
MPRFLEPSKGAKYLLIDIRDIEEQDNKSELTVQSFGILFSRMIQIDPSRSFGDKARLA